MHVFISYRHCSGATLAEEIRKKLEANHIRVWKDSKSVAESTSITAAVQRGLEDSIGAVLLYSDDYLHSPGCFLELAHFVLKLQTAKDTIPILVFKVGNGDHDVRPAVLLDLCSKDFPNQHNDDDVLQRFATTVRALLEGGRIQRKKTVQPRYYGTGGTSSVTNIPCGNEAEFWSLHDLLHPDARSQTSMALIRHELQVGSVKGGGAIDLVSIYSKLMGPCFSDIFWLSDNGDADSWMDELRTVGEALGVPLNHLRRESVQGSIAARLRKRDGPYLWIVVRKQHSVEKPDYSTTNFSGRTIIVMDGLPENSKPDLTISSLDYEETRRFLKRAVNITIENPVLDEIYGITAGYLTALKAFALLVKSFGIGFALDRTRAMDANELGLTAHMDAFSAQNRAVRELLYVISALPPDVAFPSKVMGIVFSSSANAADSDHTSWKHLEELLVLGAVSQTPDKSAFFVLPGWRKAALSAPINQTDLSALENKSARFRSMLVKALTEVMPINTRARKEEHLWQLARFARALLDEFSSEADCTLAIRCAAIYALVGEHRQELEIIERAWKWSIENHGNHHALSMELLCELTSCSELPQVQAVTLLEQALDGLDSTETLPTLRLRISQRLAIEIGDHDPHRALHILRDTYAQFESDPSILPLQHVQVRNSIGVFLSSSSSSEAIAMWEKTHEFAISAGLSDEQEVIRLEANIAGILSQSHPRLAAPVNERIYVRQLAEFGHEHHLTLWAAVSFLQSLLASGAWAKAHVLIDDYFMRYREIVRAAGRASWSMTVSSLNRPERSQAINAALESSSIELNNVELGFVLQLREIQDTTYKAFRSKSGVVPVPRNSEDFVMATLVVLELLDFSRGTEVNALRTLDGLLRNLGRYKQASAWPLIQRRLRNYYNTLNEMLERTPPGIRAMRRLAIAVVNPKNFLERLFLKNTVAAKGLPTDLL